MMSSVNVARRGLLVLSSVAVLACDDILGTPKYGADLFNAVMEVLEERSIYRDNLDWTALRAEARQQLTDPYSDVGAYPAIRRAIELLGDNHSWFRRPNGSFIAITRTLSCATPYVATPTDIPDDIGYVRVGSFSGSAADAQVYMAAIRAQMEASDGVGVVGWIVDLRGNGGGNMWPMLAALHPFLAGTVGHFITPDSQEIPWSVENGASYVGASQAAAPASGVYTPIGSTLRVAVLQDCRVASSGEATVIAFRERANTRSFGAHTIGMSTAIQAVPMPGEHLLGVAGAWMADRNGLIFAAGIAPDEAIADPAAVLTRAIEWLRETP